MQYIAYFSELLIKKEAVRQQADENYGAESGGIQMMLRNALLLSALFWLALIAGLLLFRAA